MIRRYKSNLLRERRFLREATNSKLESDTLAKLQKIYDTISECVKKYHTTRDYTEVIISPDYDDEFGDDFTALVEDPISELETVEFEFKHSHYDSAVYALYSNVFSDDYYYNDIGGLFEGAISAYTGYTNVQLYGSTPQEVVDEFPDNLEDVAEAVDYALQMGIITDIKKAFKELNEANNIVDDYNQYVSSKSIATESKKSYRISNEIINKSV